MKAEINISEKPILHILMEIKAQELEEGRTLLATFAKRPCVELMS